MTDRLGPLMQRRARLGITVSLEAKETDSLGAFVSSVTPGGPAAKAGIRSGDIITRLDGRSVLSAEGRRVSDEESLPGVRLIEMAAKLQPNQSIPVEYLRGDQRRTATVVTGDEQVIAFGEGNTFTFRMPSGESRRIPFPGLTLEQINPNDIDRVDIFRSPGGAGGQVRVVTRALLDLELAPLNADLGWYFGTEEGILVVRVSENSSLNLRPGDVVLAVDGRRPSNPASLMRILRSYEEGDTIRFEVMRQKRRETVSGTLERRNTRR